MKIHLLVVEVELVLLVLVVEVVEAKLEVISHGFDRQRRWHCYISVIFHLNFLVVGDIDDYFYCVLFYPISCCFLLFVVKNIFLLRFINKCSNVFN